MSNRDEFSAKVKRAVALRAGFRCSFEGCGRLTAGPSGESAMAVSLVGEAAHICAAAPGGRRYLASMTPEERSHINNAIWLCDSHAKLIDRDSVTYTAEELRRVKRAWEAQCELALRTLETSSETAIDLMAVGPDVVLAGEIIGIGETEWTLRLNHFVIGDIGTLVAFIDGFRRSIPGDRYVLVNALGDGRRMTEPPSLAKDRTGYVLTCRVLSSFPRISAHDLGADLALSPSHDLMLTKGGDLALVSGLEALPQRVRTSLSHQKGESPFHPEFGTRFAEYYDEYRASLWLTRLLKLEVIRQAAIPYSDSDMNCEYTPLQCVERVHGIEALAAEPSNRWLPIRVDFDVKGVGRWRSDVSALIPTDDEWCRRAEEHRKALSGLPI